MSVEVPEEFSVSAQREGSHATVTVTGELDLHSSSVLTDRLAELSDVTEIEPDAGGVSHRLAGLRALLVASKAASDRGAELRVVVLSDQMAWSSRSRASPTCCSGCRRPGDGRGDRPKRPGGGEKAGGARGQVVVSTTARCPRPRPCRPCRWRDERASPRVR